MRIGYAPNGRRPAAEAMAAARAAEAAGFAELWLSEDYCERGAFAVAGAVAAVTDRLHIGLGVVNPWTRHPVMLAMEAAALDEIAPGRVLLGLGASNARWMQSWLGNPVRETDHPAARVCRGGPGPARRPPRAAPCVRL